MTTTKEAAAALRKTLKAAGLNAHKVSVRTDYYSMGSALRVTVRDPAVPLATVRGLATAQERIDRCEVTGEILNGGNRYVEVSYSHEARASLRDSWLPLAEQALADLAEAQERHGSRTVLVHIPGTRKQLLVGWCDTYQSLELRGEGTRPMLVQHAEQLAIEVGTLLGLAA